MPLRLKNYHSFRIGFGLLALVFSLFVTQVSAQPTPPSPVPLPVPFTPIVDNANVIDPETRSRLEAIYNNLKERGKIEFAVLTVPTTGDRDIFDFTLAVARGWGIGPKDGDRAGFLLVVAVQDRKYFTQVSRHLEGDLTDGLVGQIQRQRLVPAFRQGNYSKGIFDTIQAYVATLGASRGFSIEGIDQRLAARETPQQPEGQSLGTACVGILIVGFILLMLFSASRRGGGGRGGGSGCLQALFWSTLFSNFDSGHRRGGSSGWGGGGFGGGGFGGGGGGGGFGGGFGGGGDFGGGGAGGSW